MIRTNKNGELFAQISMAIGVAIFLAACVYWLGVGLSYVEWTGFNMLYGVAGFFLMMGAVSYLANEWASKQAFLLLLGNASYSIYLVHFGLQKWMLYLLGNAPEIDINIVFMGIVFVSVAGGLIFYRVVEAPLLRYFGRRRV